MAPPLSQWQALTTSELAAAAQADAVAIQPVAAIEQHGAHLPLATDLSIAGGLLDAAATQLDPAITALQLPPLAIGDSDEHADFTGTLALRPSTLIAVLQDLGTSLVRSGVRRLILLNSHGGNREACAIAAQLLRRQAGMLAVRADYQTWPLPEDLDLPAAECREGIHGGALETSLMLALDPDAVRRGQVTATAAPQSRHVGAAERAWLAQDLAPGGIVGDPSRASAALGRRLVAHYAALLADVIRRTAEHELPGSGTADCAAPHDCTPEPRDP